MPEEFGWVFVNLTPMLYNKRNVERQLKIETWLDLYQLTRELDIEKMGRHTASQLRTYIS